MKFEWNTMHILIQNRKLIFFRILPLPFIEWNCSFHNIKSLQRMQRWFATHHHRSLIVGTYSTPVALLCSVRIALVITVLSITPETNWFCCTKKTVDILPATATEPHTYTHSDRKLPWIKLRNLLTSQATLTLLPSKVQISLKEASNVAGVRASAPSA